MSRVATLYVRNVPGDLYAELQHWATESGRSVNAEVLALLEREAKERQTRSEWLDELLRLRDELGLTKEDGDLMVASIRDDRDRGHAAGLGY